LWRVQYLDLSAEETTDILSRRLRIIQRREGHKAASDDIFLAWAAMRAYPDARRILDLGSGKGTVALLLLSCLSEAWVLGVEALPVHHTLALRNAALNGLTSRYTPQLGDLRDPEVLAGQAPFDLICGAPPYLPLGTGILPRDPGRAAGRFELRGGIEAYVHTATRHLAARGRAVFLTNGAGRRRTEVAIAEQGLVLCRRLAIRPRPRQAPTYWIIESAMKSPGSVSEDDVCMRLETGTRWSPAYAAIREALDLPDQLPDD
jgi:tRNA1Val (adenine37-N6)-methyltransferase